MEPDFSCLAVELAEQRPHMNIKVTAFTVSEKSIYTCINYPIPGLAHIFCLQRFSSIFDSTVYTGEFRPQTDQRSDDSDLQHVKGVSTQLQPSGLVTHENSSFRILTLAVSGPFMA